MDKLFKVLLLSSFLLLFACGSEEATDLTPQVVKVVDDEFSPRVLRVEPGTTVIWEPSMSLGFMNTTVRIMEQIIKGWLEQLLLAT